MKQCIVWVSVLVVVIGVVIWGGADVAQAQEPAQLILPAPCPMPLPADVVVECGVYLVPENRSSADSRMIRLPFAILRSQSDSPAPDAVVFPSNGGPGASSLDALASYVNSAFLQERDFVFVEQRGNRYAEPALHCPEVQDAIFANYSTLDHRDVEIAREVTAAAACRDRLLADGVDLTAYNSVESAADLEDLRRLLGYEAWNLVGGSYAARLVLTTLRLYPNGIRSVILDSVYNPAVNAYEQRVPTLAAALDTLFANCAANSECQAAYPALEEHFYVVVDRLNQQPLPVTIAHPRTQATTTLQLTGDDLVVGIFNALYQRNTIRVLPMVIEALYAGDTSVIEPLAQEGFSGIFSLAQGMYYSTECREEFPFNNRTVQQQMAANFPALARFLPSISEPDVCAIWGAGVADSRENAPVRSDIPALILAGAYDPVTAPEFSRQAADHLANSHFYLLPYFGHGVQAQSNCANLLASSFIADPMRGPNSQCMDDLAPINFVTVGEDLILTPWVYRLNRHLGGGGGIFMALLVIGGVLLVGQIASTLFRLRGKEHRFLRLMTGTLFLGTLGSLLGLYTIITQTDPLLLGFGLPSSARELLVAVVVVGLLWIVVSAQALRQLVLARQFPLLPSATFLTVTGLSWLLVKSTMVW